jgi:large subunit ribosomal protein L15
MPLQRRLPKRGFSNYRQKLAFQAIGVEELNCFEDGATVDMAALKHAGLVKGHDARVKITGDGDITKKVVVKAARISEKSARPERSKEVRRGERIVVSKSASEKITAAGGEIEVLK